METLKQSYASLHTEPFKSLMVSIACANMQSSPKKSLGRLFATARINDWIPARAALAVVATQTHVIFKKSSFAYGVWYQTNLCCTMPIPLGWVLAPRISDASIPVTPYGYVPESWL